MEWESPAIQGIIDQALKEDIGTGDVTTGILFPSRKMLSAVFVAKQRGVLAGLPLVIKIFKRLDEECSIQEYVLDGEALIADTIICRVTGSVAALFSGERSALNFLQRLSGIATQTADYVLHAAPLGIAVLDTRKTTPLLRILEKYAVLMGGGTNHRFGLYDRVLVKDNHLKLQPDFKKILREFQKRGYPPDQVEIEVTSLEMLKSAIDAGGQRFLLDNMTPSTIRKCVKIKRNNMYYEVSGGINPMNFSNYLIRGIDAVSIGGLTHSVKSLDISMEIEE